VTGSRAIVRATASALLLMACASPPAAQSAGGRVDVSAQVRLVPGDGDVLRQRGTFTGAPMGHGKVTLRTRLKPGGGAAFSFVMRNGRGSVSGSGNIELDFSGLQVSYVGRARITAGTGAFRRVRARGLRVRGHGALLGSSFDVRLTGRVS
jgi:hypothetical protein